jgi:DNA polymerase I-like protein with 3'-5' exonuclease and polymerase domains
MIVTSLHNFEQWANKCGSIVIADVETHPKHLLGIAMCDEGRSIYIPITVFTDEIFVSVLDPDLKTALTTFLSEQQLIGHNFTYDKGWLDSFFSIQTRWIACTRLMWHLSAAPAGPRPYSLKDAQVEVLGWTSRGDTELAAHIKAKGGNLRKGDHYLADLAVLAKYAELDVVSTEQLYNKCSTFFIQYDYWWMLEKMMAYNILLANNTARGIMVDTQSLQEEHDALKAEATKAKDNVLQSLAKEICELESDWADRRIAAYQRQYNKDRYLLHPEEWKRWNINSDKDKRELFYSKLHNPVVYTTESGLPAVDGDSIKGMPQPFTKEYLEYETKNTLTTNFTGPYLTNIKEGRIHPGFNICGTVSYRLSGFKPYLLNAPFDESRVMRHFKVDPGYIGLHTDLSAIEPTITAHYSEDPALLKVFNKGLGDIYLDLALTLFPNDKELHDGYNPNIPVTKAIKERFARQRKISKVIQLAVQYTGTGHTVARNLTKDNTPTTVQEADSYVRAYWKKFRKVAEMNYRLKELNREQGHLRNVIGRIIRVPNPNYKDLSNRFIQSSAHDVLILWVLEIYRLAAEKGVEMHPVLFDCHDSTSNAVPVAQLETAKMVYKEALESINKTLDLCVTIKAETKTFTTLAGLKGNDE